MLDEPEGASVTEVLAPGDALTKEIGASLASVWARCVGSRPQGGETELEGNAVRWTHTEEKDELANALEGDADDAARPARSADSYRRELSAAVARTTHRRVTALISKQDKEAGTATETFILENPPRKN
jgi:hypothetical protein